MSQEFDNNILDLVRQNEFCPYEYMSDSEKFMEELPSREKFYSSLTDVFEKFRNNSLKNYRLSPSHYFSAPCSRWDAMLKMTKIELEIIPDPDMCMFFEKFTGRRISYISNRYSKANNRYLKSYDPRQESKHVIYLDTNNLYGYAMSKFLPTSGFK